MTREEFTNIVLALKSVYNAPSFLATSESVTIWYEILKDLDYKTCHMAVVAYMAREEKIPTPASIRKIALQSNGEEELNETTAWALVSRALRNGTYGAKEEFDKLPDAVKKAVGSPEQLHNWATTDEKTVETVIASNFQRTYRTVIERQNKVDLLPQNLQRFMGLTDDVNPKLIERGDYE